MSFALVLGASLNAVHFELGCFAWAVAGLIGGWLAGLIVRGRGYGCIGDILLGIAGAFVAAILLQIFAPPGFTGGQVFGFIGTTVLAFLGALLLALLGRLIGGSRSKQSF